jgi:hypothetical protein
MRSQIAIDVIPERLVMRRIRLENHSSFVSEAEELHRQGRTQELRARYRKRGVSKDSCRLCYRRPKSLLPDVGRISDSLVVYGATGNLADKMIFPRTLRDGETWHPQSSCNRRGIFPVEPFDFALPNPGESSKIILVFRFQVGMDMEER